MTRIAWGSGACPGCGHFWAQHATPPELERGITCHGLGTCTCRLARMAALVGLEEGAGLPLEYRDEGEVVAHLDAVAVAARNLFEGLQHAMAAVLRRAPAPPAAECRHCGRALQLGPTPGQDPVLFSSVSWLDADGSASCRGQGPTDPGTYLAHQPMPPRHDPTGLPLHRCPGCQMLHPYPQEV